MLLPHSVLFYIANISPLSSMIEIVDCILWLFYNRLLSHFIFFSCASAHLDWLVSFSVHFAKRCTLCYYKQLSTVLWCCPFVSLFSECDNAMFWCSMLAVVKILKKSSLQCTFDKWFAQKICMKFLFYFTAFCREAEMPPKSTEVDRSLCLPTYLWLIINL